MELYTDIDQYRKEENITTKKENKTKIFHDVINIDNVERDIYNDNGMK